MKIIAKNRKAYHDFHVFDTYDAGIVLRGSEAKSLRQGTAAISDAYAEIYDGEVFLIGLHIGQYQHNTGDRLDPKRKRKLLLNRREIRKIHGHIQQRGSTLIPLKIYFNERGYAKVTLGVCQRKRLYDKKEKIMKAEIKQKVDQIKKTRA